MGKERLRSKMWAREKENKAENVFNIRKTEGKGRVTTGKNLRTLGQQYESTSGRLVAPTWHGAAFLRTYKLL